MGVCLCALRHCVNLSGIVWRPDEELILCVNEPSLFEDEAKLERGLSVNGAFPIKETSIGH